MFVWFRLRVSSHFLLSDRAILSNCEKKNRKEKKDIIDKHIFKHTNLYIDSWIEEYSTFFIQFVCLIKFKSLHVL